MLDGTATGILGQLPKFSRPRTLIEPATGTARQQFIFNVTRLRKFLDTLFRTAVSTACNATFAVDSPDSRAADSMEMLHFPRGDALQTEETKAINGLINV